MPRPGNTIANNAATKNEPTNHTMVPTTLAVSRTVSPVSCQYSRAVRLVELDAAGDHGAGRHVGRRGTPVEQRAAHACVRTDHELLGADLDVAVDGAVDAHLCTGRLEVALRVAVELHATAGQRRRAADHGGGSDLDVTRRDADVPVDDRVDRHVAARDIQVVADAATDRNVAAGRGEVALDLARDRDIAAGQECVTRRPDR